MENHFILANWVRTSNNYSKSKWHPISHINLLHISLGPITRGMRFWLWIWQNANYRLAYNCYYYSYESQKNTHKLYRYIPTINSTYIHLVIVINKTTNKFYLNKISLTKYMTICLHFSFLTVNQITRKIESYIIIYVHEDFVSYGKNYFEYES